MEKNLTGRKSGIGVCTGVGHPGFNRLLSRSPYSDRRAPGQGTCGGGTPHESLPPHPPIYGGEPRGGRWVPAGTQRIYGRSIGDPREDGGYDGHVRGGVFTPKGQCQNQILQTLATSGGEGLQQ